MILVEDSGAYTPLDAVGKLLFLSARHKPQSQRMMFSTFLKAQVWQATVFLSVLKAQVGQATVFRAFWER